MGRRRPCHACLSCCACWRHGGHHVAHGLPGDRGHLAAQAADRFRRRRAGAPHAGHLHPRQQRHTVSDRHATRSAACRHSPSSSPTTATRPASCGASATRATSATCRTTRRAARASTTPMPPTCPTCAASSPRCSSSPAHVRSTSSRTAWASRSRASGSARTTPRARCAASWRSTAPTTASSTARPIALNYWQAPALGGFTPQSEVCVEVGSPNTSFLKLLNKGDDTPGPTQYLVIRNADTSFVYFALQDGLIAPVPAEDSFGQPTDFSRSATLHGARQLDLSGPGRVRSDPRHHAPGHSQLAADVGGGAGVPDGAASASLRPRLSRAPLPRRCAGVRSRRATRRLRPRARSAGSSTR